MNILHDTVNTALSHIKTKTELQKFLQRFIHIFKALAFMCGILLLAFQRIEATMFGAA